MKKTLIALMALAGVTFGTDYTYTELWTAQFGSAYDSGYTTTLTSAGKFWDAGDVKTEFGAQTTGNKRIHMEGGTYGDFGTSFEFNMVLTLTGDNFSNGHISEIKAGSTSDWLCLGVNNGALTLSGNKLGNVTSMGTVELGTQYTCTLTKIDSTITFTVGDASATATLGSVSGVINNITLGGNTGGNQRVPVLVESIGWSTIVPEPATATLSLLALAGLAARRRRK
jgi:hypothetical protein